MKAIDDFCARFGVTFTIPAGFVLRAIGRQLHLFTEDQARILDSRQPVFGGGILLGSIEKNMFTPSAQFVDMYLSASASTLKLDDRTAWLFLCGRDVLPESGIPIQAPAGSSLVVKDAHGRILGYGSVPIQRTPRLPGNQRENRYQPQTVLLKNEWDRGMLLRREMSR